MIRTRAGPVRIGELPSTPQARNTWMRAVRGRMNAADLLIQRLEMVYRWYRGMVRPDTAMLKYL